MANYYAFARSNKFRVKDIKALEDVLPSGVELWIEDEPSNLVCLLVSDDGGWPSACWNESLDDVEDWDVVDAIAPHLADNQWCVIQEVGAEKLRYLCGWSLAFDSSKRIIRVDIEDIYEKLPKDVTPCAY